MTIFINQRCQTSKVCMYVRVYESLYTILKVCGVWILRSWDINTTHRWWRRVTQALKQHDVGHHRCTCANKLNARISM